MGCPVNGYRPDRVTGLSPHHPTICAGCGAQIWFALTTKNAKLMPLDAAPNPDGNAAVHQDVRGIWMARVLGKGQGPYSYEKLFLPHFATCTNPGAFRRQVGRERERLAPVIDIRTRQRIR